MGLGHSPKIVTNGLVLCLDAANANKSAKGFRNINPLTDWTLGTGGTASYFQVGLTSENQRILDTGPFGVSAVVWDNATTDIASNDDGGFVTANYTIDPTKLYRFSIWMRRKVIGNGSSYLGCQAWDASTTQHVLNRSNGSTNINPYFLATNYWGNVNEWYLVTGHIWPAGSGTGISKEDSGIYTTAGTKISSTTDFVWQTTNTYTLIRSFLYYSTDTTTNQQMYQPRIDLCDGTEPTIADLIAGVGSKWYDIAGANHASVINTASPYNSAGYINFDGIDDYYRPSINHSYLNSSALEVIFNSASHGTGNKTIFGYSHNEAYSNPTIGSIYLNNNTLSASLITASQAYRVATHSTTIQTNQTYHVVLNKDTIGGTMQLFVNGVPGSVQTFDAATYGQWTTAGNYIGSNVLDIGKSTNTNASQGWGSDYFNGKMYKLAVYSRILTNQEILQNFNALRGRFGI